MDRVMSAREFFNYDYQKNPEIYKDFIGVDDFDKMCKYSDFQKFLLKRLNYSNKN